MSQNLWVYNRTSTTAHAIFYLIPSALRRWRNDIKWNEGQRIHPIHPNSAQLVAMSSFFQDFPEEIQQYIYIYVYNIIKHIITSSLIRFPRSAWISQTKIGRQIMFERIQAMDRKCLMFDEFSDMFNERVSMARISWIIYYIYIYII